MDRAEAVSEPPLTALEGMPDMLAENKAVVGRAEGEGVAPVPGWLTQLFEILSKDDPAPQGAQLPVEVWGALATWLLGHSVHDSAPSLE